MTQVLCTTADKSPTGYFPFEPTRDPEGGMSPVIRMWNRAFGFADQSASEVAVPIPPNSRVLRVELEISEAWTGTTAVVVGDGTTADGWIASGTINPLTAGDFGFDYDSTYGVKGKFYADGDTLDVAFTGIATAGSAILWVEMISYGEALAAETVT
ncbi:MAG TPA: hypothetical protein VMW58_11685 [Anaerolineae bacterium]|nr:hypothetical protein [Anaerolineae bacterium]